MALGEAGIPLGICTSKRMDFAERILEMFGLRHYFHFVDGGEIGIHKWRQIESLLAQSAVSTSTMMVGDTSVRFSPHDANADWWSNIAASYHEVDIYSMHIVPIFYLWDHSI